MDFKPKSVSGTLPARGPRGSPPRSRSALGTPGGLLRRPGTGPDGLPRTSGRRRTAPPTPGGSPDRPPGTIRTGAGPESSSAPRPLPGRPRQRRRPGPAGSSVAPPSQGPAPSRPEPAPAPPSPPAASLPGAGSPAPSAGDPPPEAFPPAPPPRSRPPPSSDQPRAGPVGMVVPDVVPGVRHDQAQLLLPRDAHVDRLRRRRPVHDAAVVQLHPVGPDLEDDRRVGSRLCADLVVHPDVRLERGVLSTQRDADLGVGMTA